MFAFNFISLLFFAFLRLNSCANGNGHDSDASSVTKPSAFADTTDTFATFNSTNGKWTTTTTTTTTNGDGTTTPFRTETTVNFGTQTFGIQDAMTTNGKNEFEKSSTFVPAYFTQKVETDGSTPQISAVYEDIPEDDHSGQPMTETSLFTNTNTGPIYVTLAESHHEICDFCIYEGEGNFTSYGYPLDYRAGLNCSYRVQRVDDGDVCELEMVFHDFDVPISSDKSATKNGESNDCREDYLEVYGRRFCGPAWKGKIETVPFPATEKEVTFYFKSNDAGSGRGFWVEVRRKPGTCYDKKPVTSCEERFSDSEFYITSPRFPNEYPHNSECTYYIRRSTNEVCGLEFTFLHFDLEPVNGCFYDYLEINGQKYCGTLAPNTVKTLSFTEDQKVVTFHSDKQASKSGYQIRVQQLTQCRVPARLPPPPTCNVCTNERSGILVSYNYPNHYRNNLLCSYTIDRYDPSYCNVELQFVDFDILPSVDCSDDYLQVKNKRFCGTTLHSTRQVVDFDHNSSVNMVLKTNPTATSKGFQVRYKQLRCPGGKEPAKGKKEPPDTSATDEHEMCDYSYSDKTFTIRSENVSNSYPNNVKCNYYVHKNSSSVCYLELTFLKFDVEASPQCQFDFLEINNVRLCGSLQKETTRTYIFEENEKRIKFQSDASTNREGYVIKVDQLECQGDAIIRSSTISSVTQPSTGLPYFPSVPAMSACGQTFVGLEFEVVSPQYPNIYPLSSDCMFVVEKYLPTICRLEVTYYDFAIAGPDLNGYCKYDYLDFNGIRMCGEVMKGNVRNYYFPESAFNIRFHSDSLFSLKERGFRIGVRQGECGQTVTLPDTSRDPSPFKCDEIFTKPTFELRSPNYPETYPTNINCQFTVIKKTDGVPVCQLEVHFTDVRLEDDVDCQGDHLDFDGKKFCGPQPANLIKFFPFERSEFKIKFKTDGTNRGYNKKGFFLQIRQRECPDGFSVAPSQPEPKPTSPGPKMEYCNQLFIERSFEIISPRYPAMYENNLDCYYVIKRHNPRVCRVDLLFVDFDVEEGSDCERDYLSIDGMKMCGQYKSNTVRSFLFTESEKIVVFHSDPARIKGGFYIKGQQKECEGQIPINGNGQRPVAPPINGNGQRPVTPPISVNGQRPVTPPISAPLPSICEICFAETAGEIKSYGYPSNSQNNLNCNYKITGFPDYCSVYIKFDEFSLEPPTVNGCVNDYLEINGTRYCGSQLQGQKKIVVFTGSPKEVTLKFVTNEHTNSRGFRGSYTQFPCPDVSGRQTPSTESSHPLPGVITTGTGPITVIHHGTTETSKVPRIPCDLVVFEKSFEIKSPDYPYTYPPNSDCLYSIRRTSQEICKVKLEYAGFDIEQSTNCMNDYLEVDGNKLCGTILHNTREYDFKNYKFAIRFRSDTKNEGKGFLIRGRQIDCSQKKFPSPHGVPPMQSSSELAPHYPTYPIDPVQRDLSPQQQPHAPYDLSTGTARSNYPGSYPVPPYSPVDSLPPSLPRDGFSKDMHSYPPLPSLTQPTRNNGPSRFDVGPMQSGFDRMEPPSQIPVPGSPQISFQHLQQPLMTSQFGTGTMSYPSGHSLSMPSCNRVITDAFFDIKSPHFPFRYKEDTKCMFIIKKIKPNVCHLDLMFITFEVGDFSCQRDFLSVEGERLCGLIPKEKIKTFKFDFPEKFIYFNGVAGGGLGFHIRGRQVECANPVLSVPTQQQQIMLERIRSEDKSTHPLAYCDQTLSETEFKVISPNYPNNYPSNLYCRFTIIRPSNSICALEMKFLTFDVEDDPKCAKDYLEIDNGKICGHLPPNHERRYYYFPEEQKKTFIFRTDSLAAKSGFEIDIKQITDCSLNSWKPESLPPPVCDLCNNDVRGHFTSSNYPKDYDNYVRCTYRISPFNENYCKVRLHIRDLDIEESSACDKDYLYIQNERICNTNYRPKEITVYFPQFGVKEIQFSFHSDSRNSGRGFYVEYLQELCTTSHLKPGNGHQYPSTGQTGDTQPSDSAHHSHKGRSYYSPQYPPNYVSKAHIEEIVETRVKVLDPRQDPPPKIEVRNPEEVKPVTIDVQLPASSNIYRNLTAISN